MERVERLRATILAGILTLIGLVVASAITTFGPSLARQTVELTTPTPKTTTETTTITYTTSLVAEKCSFSPQFVVPVGQIREYPQVSYHGVIFTLVSAIQGVRENRIVFILELFLYNDNASQVRIDWTKASLVDNYSHRYIYYDAGCDSPTQNVGIRAATDGEVLFEGEFESALFSETNLPLVLTLNAVVDGSTGTIEFVFPSKAIMQQLLP